MGFPEGFATRDVNVGGTTMRYREAGHGQPVVFLHGNPTSSHLWRAVLPLVARRGLRLIAVDLIGMGGSGKPAIGYHLSDHVEHVLAFIDALSLTGIVFVGHDWGVAISLECLRARPGRVRAVALMEGHVRPVASWADFDAGGRELFQRLRTPGVGERLVLEENFLIETLLPAGLRRALPPEDWDVYRAPYPDPESRRPLLQWTREIPVEGRPAGVARSLTRAWQHLAGSSAGKLLIHGRPGAVIDTAAVSWCRRTVPDLEVADVGEGAHFLPEDRPAEVAAALNRWLAAIL